MTFGLIRKGAGLLAVSFIAAAAVAQNAGGQGAAQPAEPAGPALNIPQDVNFVPTRSEPNVARATAIVNEEIITRTDVDQRVALFMAAQRVQLPAEELERLRQQVLRSLIDETLQIQAARQREITVEQRQIDAYFERFAQQFGHTPRTFGEYLRSVGSSERTVRRQIMGEVSWQMLQRRLPQVSVGAAEVQAMLDRMLAARGTAEYRVAEIYISAVPENAQQVRGRLAQIIEQIRAGGAFQAYARQYSEASTSAVGGDLGWVRVEQLPPELAAVVQQLPVGALSDPIQVSGGFSVVALTDSRQVLTANPRDAQMSLLQMSIELPAGTSEAVARARAQEMATATQAMGGCGRAAETATAIRANLVSNDNVQIRELPPQLQQMLLAMSIGQATQPFGSAERISVLVLCGRDDPQAAQAPTVNSITEALGDERMTRQAQRFLRDLRRDAVVEYR